MAQSKTATRKPSKMASTKFATVDQYLASLNPKAKSAAKEMRKIIKQAAPGAEEVISYNMPAFKLNGMLVWYAAWQEHVGLYPKTNVIKDLAKELSGYEQSKGTIKFPMSAPLPVTLITKIVKLRIAVNLEHQKAKSKK